MLDLHCCAGFSLGVESGGYCPLGVCRLLIVVASLLWSTGSVGCGLQYLWHVGSIVAVPRLESTGSIVVVHRLSCSAACGVFSDLGSNLCLLLWQVESFTTKSSGKPRVIYLN